MILIGQYIDFPKNEHKHLISLSMEWNSMRLSDREPQKLTKTVRKTVLSGGMVSCGVVSCGVVSCGMVTCGMVTCGVVTCGMVACAK